MITAVEIIHQPRSGKYKERIYENNSVWSSADWSWIKFTNDDYQEWCGHFRGAPYGAEISAYRKEVLILTSDFLFLLDSKNGNVIEELESRGLRCLTLSPNGDFIVADYYQIQRLKNGLTNMECINSPIKMDSIVFKNWDNDSLIITCEEFANWDRKLEMQLDPKTWEMRILKSTEEHS
ncbi:hypothetical protein [Leptospira noguchii]|uniref:Uncharacterized protein n=1 Tax=Leptospira noguchii TaxID=28182 RepID=M6VE78_9LEPT|nr:hypothetical protein [Leptospira noguchii]EMO55170.1 hypothetical protein LEP1GSC172_2289 [Leptospira noguchii]